MKREKSLLSIVLTSAVVMASWNVAADEDRSDVLERVKPVGSVAVTGQAAPAAKKEAAPAAEKQAAAAPAEEKKAETPVAEAASAQKPAAGGDTLALATSKGCMACHQLAIKVVGPAYKNVAAKYKDDADALAKLLAKVKAGGKGNWGEIPMPPQAHVPEAELITIIKWVLTQ